MRIPISPILLLVAAFTAIPSQAQTSQLWGENGELWNPETSRLRDFTNVGYMSGNAAIPDWPVGANVTNFGAIPGDGIDDTQAFRDAIAACPDNHAILVPNGRYTILQQIIPDRNNFVLRGESMYGAILHCPKNLNEIYVQEIGYDPNDPGKRHTGVPKGFFRVTGGTHRSIENLTFEFRDQIKMGHWEHKGADAIFYGGNTVDSWVRNIHFRNVDHGVMMDKAQRISFLNLMFDHSVVRRDISGNLNMAGWVGHMGINFSGAQHCLFHNIEFKGKYFHEIDLNDAPKHNVVSNVSGINMQVHHHGMGADYNLYTNIHVGRGDRSLLALADNRGQDQETHWNFRGDTTFDPAVVPQNSIKNHVFVGFGAGLPTTITDTFWYEAIDPGQLHPQNIYIAQMEKAVPLGKQLPAGPPPQPPSPYSGNVIVINPTDDNITKSGTPETIENPENVTIGLGGYYRFDLDGLNLDSIHKVRFRINAKGGKSTPSTLGVFSVESDDWTQDTINHNNRPTVGNVLNTVVIPADFSEEWFEFDITPHVQAEWADDKTVSLHLARTAGANLTGSFRTRENGNAPQLVIEKAPSPVAGAPAAPTGVRTESIIGNIRLDWEDNKEADVVSYNVYRHSASAEMNAYGEAVGMGLVTSDFVDTSSVADWSVGMMRSDVVYYYRVTAVDSHGYESPASAEIIGTTLDPNNQPPSFSSNPATLPGAQALAPYSANLTGFAADPESDVLFFSKIDGPAWLTVNHDGTLTGTPGASDVGPNEFTIQVNARGGRAEAVIRIQVEENANPPEPPAAPQGLEADPGDGVIELNWNDNSEADFGHYLVYRAPAPNGDYTIIATNVTASQYADSDVVNGTTYNYVVRAVSTVPLESPNSNVATATPLAEPAADTIFLGGLITTAANWSNGLPVGQVGRINVNATVDTAVILNNYHILHTGGTIAHTGIPALEMINGSSWITDGATATTSTAFRGFTLRSGSTFALNQGVIHTTSGRDWTVADAGSSITVNGGTLNLGRHLLLNGTAGASFTINGGVINGNTTSGDIGARSIHDTAKTFNFNGGTTTTYRLDPGGDNTVFNFGGILEGSLTAASFVGTFGANSFLNFLPGTRMSLRLTASDEWAASHWNSGRLRYNGMGTAQLGTWAAVTTSGGLGEGTRFDYDSATETLRVVFVDLPPAAPANLAATAGDSVINLDWDDNTEADFTGYTVYRSGTGGSGFIAIASGLTDSNFEDTEVTNYTDYFYAVTATDLAENESAFSSEVSATPIDLTPPEAPHDLVAMAGDGLIALDWDADCDCGEDVDHYKLYRRTNPTGAFEVAASNLTDGTHIDSGLANGTTYHYVLTAFDAAGNESMVSSQVSATPQTGAMIQSDFTGGDLANSASWGFGFPNNGMFTGSVRTDGTLASMLTDFTVLHTSGTISVTGIVTAGFSGGSYTLDGGTWNAGARGFNATNGAAVTIESGTMTTGANAHSYVTNSSITIYGGTLLNNPTGTRSLFVSGSTYTQNGGTVSIGGVLGNATTQPVSAVNFNGGNFTAGGFNFQKPSVATFGGDSPGTVTVTTATGLSYNWLTGSQMSLTITGTAGWAETAWNTGKLTYNGQGSSQLGTWTAVTVTGGLGGGYRFDYESGTLSLTTSPSHYPPVAADGSAVTNEDTPVVVTLDATDIDSASLSYTVASAPTQGVLSGTAPNLTYTPNANASGADSFTFIANDGLTDSNVATISLTVNAVNDAPVAADGSADTNEDNSVAVTLLATDIDSGTLTYTVVTAPAKGFLSGTAPNFIYIPDANANGTDSFTFIANDGLTDSNVATVSLTVNAANDAPVAADGTTVTDEDTPVTVTLGASDIDSSTLTYTVVSAPVKGVLSGTAPNLTYIPDANANGTDSFTFIANDGTADSNVATIGLTVNAVNDAPAWTVNPIIAAGAEEGIAYSGQSLVGKATDADSGDTISYSKVNGPAWLAVAADGTLSGTPASGSSTTNPNSFTVRATDGSSATADATLQITVTGLPLPWVSSDIGTGMLAGSATHNAGTFTQGGSGIIGSTGDKLRYTYQALTGDGEIIARISALQNSGTSSRVGVMIRDTLAANSKQIFMGMTGANAYRWVRRTTTGGNTSSTNSSSGTIPNTWVRLVRSGTTITAYRSTNGTSWTIVGSTTNTTFASTCYIGLAVGSGSATTLNVSQFSNVSVTP